MFGKGRINIKIPKTHYKPGENITGSVILNLKKSVTAREMSISLVGELKTTQTRFVRSGGTSTSYEKQRIYDFKQDLDYEKEYNQGEEYNFEIKIPANILDTTPQMPEIGGNIGQGIRFVQAAATMAGVIPRQQIKWYLQVRLDIPGGLDVKRKTDVIID
jgi:hypothetical protein